MDRRKSSSRVFSQSSDMNKRKKVKFLDPVSPRPQRCRSSPNVVDAKTSEYKSFRRLLGESDHKSRFNQFTNHGQNLKTFEVGDCIREKNDSERPFSPIQTVTPIAHRSPPSSKISHDFELENDNKCKLNTCDKLSPIKKPVAERFSLSPGPEHEYEGLFSKTRKNLLRTVAEASSHNVEDILPNKSDLILEYMQRLGTGQKSEDFGDLAKPKQKLSCGKYHSSASLNSYGENKESQKFAGVDAIHKKGRKWETDLLNPGCREANKLIASPVDHFVDQALIWKSNLHPDNNSASTSDLGLYQTLGHELITLPQEFRWNKEVTTNPVGHQGILPWHSNSMPDDYDGTFEKNSAYREYSTKVDEFIPLPCDRAKAQHFPCKFLNADFQSRSWCSDALFEEQGDYTEYHTIEAGLQGRNKHFISFPGGISDFHTENGLTSVVELGMEFECNSGFGLKHHFQSSFGYRNLNKFPCEDRSIVPYTYSASPYDVAGLDLYRDLAKDEQCSLPLIECHATIEPELSPTLCNAPGLLDRSEGLTAIDVYQRRNICSSPSSCTVLTPRFGIEPDWNNLLIALGREKSWSIYTIPQFDEEDENCGLGSIATRNKFEFGCEDMKNLMEFKNHLPVDFLSGQGLKFSEDREKSVFGLLPERLSWH